MKSVYLDYSYNEYYVDEESYQEIVRLVKASQLCKRDWHPFSEDNPCVGKSLCLEHLLQGQTSLTYQGVEHTDIYGRRIYRYLDQEGYIFLSTEDSSTEASKSLQETLVHYSSFPPKTVTYRERTVEYDSYYATLYGTIATSSVIVLSFDKRSTEIVKGLYLLYNDGTHKELAKRGEHK